MACAQPRLHLARAARATTAAKSTIGVASARGLAASVPTGRLAHVRIECGVSGRQVRGRQQDEFFGEEAGERAGWWESELIGEHILHKARAG